VHLLVRSRRLDLSGPPLVMGIVNVTPDSFYDNGISATPELALERAREMLAAGASIIDVGGMTAQPGPLLDAEAEIERVVPVVAGLRAADVCPISVDTYRAEVAEAALAAGADIVNDHTGLSDPDMAATVARHRAGLVVTHLGLAPKQEQTGRYDLPPGGIASQLLDRAACAEAAGVRRESVLLDPGLGFGKSTATDLETLRALPMLLSLGYPLLLACSHKEVTAEPLELPEASIEGSAAVTAIAAHLGVHVLRLHDLPFMARVAHMGWLTSARARAVAQADGGDRSGANSGTNRPSR